MSEHSKVARSRRSAIRSAVGLAMLGPVGRWFVVIATSTVFGLLDAAGTLLVFTTLSDLLDGGGVQESASVAITGSIVEPSSGPLLVLGYFVIRSVLFVVVSRHAVRVSGRAASAVGEAVLVRTLAIPLDRLEGQGDVRLQRMAFSSVGTLSSAVFPGLATMLLDGVVITAVLAVLLLIAPVTTIVAVILIGGGFSLTQLAVGSRLARNGAAAHDATRSTLEAVDAASRHAIDIRVFRLQDIVVDRYRDARARLTDTVANRSGLSAAPRAALEVIVLVALLAVGWVSSRMSMGAAEATATIGLLGYAALRLQPAIQRLADSITTVRFFSSELRELEEFLEYRGAEQGPARGPYRLPSILPDSPIGVAAQGVTFSFRAGPPVLHSIDLDIRPGSRVAVLGASGSGKSTLLRVIAGLYAPTNGTVSWLTDATGDPGDMVEPVVALVASDHAPWRGSLRYNIRLGAGGIDREVDVDAAVHHAGADDVLIGLASGLDAEIGPGGAQLSRGQEQRIAIARAFAASPRLIILDEATSGLPIALERSILERFQRLPATIIVATHRTDIALDLDRVIIVRSGRIVEDGPPDTVLSSDAYSELVRNMSDTASPDGGRP